MQTPPTALAKHGNPWLGLGLVAAGVLLLALAGTYVLYGRVATRELDSLVSLGRRAPPIQATPSTLTLEGLRNPGSFPVSRSASTPGSTPIPGPAGLLLYPGELLAFNYWAEPWTAQPPPPLREEWVQGFLPADRIALAAKGTLPAAKRIRIPAIAVDAEVQELRILNLRDSREYETPNKVVGHIPEGSNPGEEGNGWLFGHLQSPLRGEGSVFRDLPRIPEILPGQPVYIVLDGPAGSYLYEVYKTEVVHQDDLRLYDTEEASITLVTCVPLFTYDHRLLVEARLVGFKPW